MQPPSEVSKHGKEPKTAPWLRWLRASKRDEEFKTRNIGIHGSRSTGKTCYLACCLYGESVSEGVAFVRDDSASFDSLKNAWEMLTRGELPQANAVTVPDNISFCLNAEQVWKVQTKDYAGSLVQISDTGVLGLRDDVRTWLAESDAILILVNADLCSDDPAARERMSEIDVLLTKLLDESDDGNKVAQPLALLLTKWDVQGPISDDPAQEEQRARAYLQSESVFHQIAEKIARAGERVKVFPVSAFGSHRERNLPPAGGPCPFNLHAPLHWAAQQSDEMLYASAKRKAESLLGKKWQWKNKYSSAIACYNDLINTKGINKGPIFDRISAELQPLKVAESDLNKARFKRLIWQIPLTFMIIIVLCLALLFVLDAKMYQRALDDLVAANSEINDSRTEPNELLELLQNLDLAHLRRSDNPTAPSPQPSPPESPQRGQSNPRIGSNCESYLASSNPLSKLSGHQAKVQEQLDESRSRLKERIADDQKRDFDKLKDSCDTHEKDEDAQLRLDKCNRFLADWKKSPYDDDVQEWLRNAQTLVKEMPKYRDFDEAFSDWDTAMKNAAPDSHVERRNLCDAFIKLWPESKYPKRKAKIDEVSSVRESARIAIEDSRWRQVEEKTRTILQPNVKGGSLDNQQYEDAIKAVKEYLGGTHPLADKTKVAEELVETIAWRKVTDYAEKSPSNHDEIVKRVREYIERTDVNKAHLDNAQTLEREQEIEWDRAVFENVIQTASPAYKHDTIEKSPQAIVDAKKVAKDYLRTCGQRLKLSRYSANPRYVQFWKELNSWTNRVAALETSKSATYQVTVRRVRIPEGSLYYSNPKFRVEVELSGQSRSTDFVQTESVDLYLGLPLKPFNCTWGTKGKVKVVVEEDLWFGKKTWETSFSEDKFVPGRAQGLVRIPARNDEEIEVELYCDCINNVGTLKPAVPPLPEYPLKP